MHFPQKMTTKMPQTFSVCYHHVTMLFMSLK